MVAEIGCEWGLLGEKDHALVVSIIDLGLAINSQWFGPARCLPTSQPALNTK